MRAHALGFASLSAFTRINANEVSCVCLCACVRLRACSCVGLKNAFTRQKKSQNTNALWVQKLSGCTITVYIRKFWPEVTVDVLISTHLYAYSMCVV